MFYLIEHKHYQKVINAEKISDVLFCTADNLDATDNPELGDWLRVTMTNKDEFYFRGQFAKEIWEAISRDAYFMAKER